MFHQCDRHTPGEKCRTALLLRHLKVIYDALIIGGETTCMNDQIIPNIVKARNVQSKITQGDKVSVRPTPKQTAMQRRRLATVFSARGRRHTYMISERIGQVPV